MSKQKVVTPISSRVTRPAPCSQSLVAAWSVCCFCNMP